MNIRDMAYSIYANRDNRNLCHVDVSKDNPLYTMTQDEYADYVLAEHKKRWESGEIQQRFLFNGSDTRAQLSKTELIALANKYDLRNMDDKTYDAFLDDLESMGAISNYEKGLLGYHQMLQLGGPDENGDMPDMVSTAWIVNGDETPLFDRQDAEGDIVSWLNDRIKWTAGGSNDRDNQYRTQRAHNVLADLVNRIQRERTKLESTKVPEKQETTDNEQEELLRQLADADSDFYKGMTQKILEQARKLEEERKKQATIDALAEMLDSLSGKNDDKSENGVRETQNGVALGMNADQENTFQKGFMPLELQVYLRNLGVSGAFEALEPDEDQEVQEPESTEGVNEVRSPEEAVAELAKEYNPRHMSREEFQSFMDALAESGAMSPEAAERVKNAGQWVVTVQDQYGNTVEPLAWKENGGTPADSRIMPFLFGEHSMDGDVLAWARLGSANSDFRDLVDILSRMENQREQTVSAII